MREPFQTQSKAVKWSKKILLWKEDLLHLVYPSSCLCCAKELSIGMQNLCDICDADLRYTYFENFTEPSALDKLFWGRCNLTSTCAFLQFEKDSSTQKILHAMKYKGKKDLAEEMGHRFGERLKQNQLKYDTIEVLIPVPLHPKKKFIRGYNQSECIANGISSSTKMVVNTKFLTKGVHTESQTKKANRFLRWDNVSDVFHLDISKLNGVKHIALVDDVVTTGSTLESCIQKIQKVLPDIQITVLSLAIAK
jgi:ComF family protein